MKYISIGAVMTEGTEHILDVCRGSRSYHLTGELATVWLNGRFGFATVKKPTEEQTLLLLLRMGLAIQTDGDRRDEVYNVRALKAVIEVEDDHAQRCAGLELVKLPRVYQRERPRGKRIAAAVYGKRSDTGGHIKNAVVTGTDLPPDRDENDILGKPEIRVHITQQHNNNSFCDRHGKA